MLLKWGHRVHCLFYVKLRVSLTLIISVTCDTNCHLVVPLHAYPLFEVSIAFVLQIYVGVYWLISEQFNSTAIQKIMIKEFERYKFLRL